MGCNTTTQIPPCPVVNWKWDTEAVPGAPGERTSWGTEKGSALWDWAQKMHLYFPLRRKLDMISIINVITRSSRANILMALPPSAYVLNVHFKMKKQMKLTQFAHKYKVNIYLSLSRIENRCTMIRRVRCWAWNHKESVMLSITRIKERTALEKMMKKKMITSPTTQRHRQFN